MDMFRDIGPIRTEERYLTLDEISDFLQVPKSTLHKYTSRNTTRPRLKGIRIGRVLRFRMRDVDLWVKELENVE
jgi:excisionase family DNA binding protein